MQPVGLVRTLTMAQGGKGEGSPPPPPISFPRDVSDRTAGRASNETTQGCLPALGSSAISESAALGSQRPPLLSSVDRNRQTPPTRPA